LGSVVDAARRTAFSVTECTQSQFEFEAHFLRRVVAEFSGERLTTEGGSLLLRHIAVRVESAVAAVTKAPRPQLLDCKRTKKERDLPTPSQ
jgi:hypothetical protein